MAVRPFGWLWKKYRVAIQDGTDQHPALYALPLGAVNPPPPGDTEWPDQRLLAPRRLFPQESVWPNPVVLVPPPPPVFAPNLPPPGETAWPDQRLLAPRRLFPQQAVWLNPALQPQAGEVLFGPNRMVPGVALYLDRIPPRRRLHPMPHGEWNSAVFFAGFAPAQAFRLHNLPLMGVGR